MDKLGNLISQAKGTRTCREYASDSGIDSAVISKIISGKYRPKKREVYRKLTSEEAKPQNGITFEMIDRELSSDAARMVLTSFIPGVGPLAACMMHISQEANIDSYETDRYK